MKKKLGALSAKMIDKAISISWHQAHPEYLAAYYQAHKKKKNAFRTAWRNANSARDKAHRRIRLLAAKEDAGIITEGEVEQMLELGREFPKRIYNEKIYR